MIFANHFETAPYLIDSVTFFDFGNKTNRQLLAHCGQRAV